MNNSGGEKTFSCFPPMPSWSDSAFQPRQPFTFDSSASSSQRITKGISSKHSLSSLLTLRLRRSLEHSSPCKIQTKFILSSPTKALAHTRHDPFERSKDWGILKENIQMAGAYSATCLYLFSDFLLSFSHRRCGTKVKIKAVNCFTSTHLTNLKGLHQSCTL